MRDISASPRPMRLDAEIKAERDVVKRGCLRAERAGILARQGYFDIAQADLDELQSEFTSHPNVNVSAWALVARGWLAHSLDNPAQSLGYMRRAHALSVAANVNVTRSISGAWLANFAYLRDEFTAMADLLKDCLKSVDSDNHAAQSRMCMVFALGYHFADRFDVAQSWYVKAREHASVHNDEATLSALSYNAAARRSVSLLRASIFGLDVGNETLLAKTGLESSRNFDSLFGVNILSQWAPLVQATVFSSMKQFEPAVRLYAEHLQQATERGRLVAHRASFLADAAWCLFNIGDSELAQQHAAEASSLISDEMYVEDKVTACGRLGQYYSASGNDALAAKFLADSLHCKQALEVMQLEVCKLLDAVVNASRSDADT